MKPKVAYFTNIAPHYREKLWLSLAKDLGVEFHFYFGYHPTQSIKPIDFTTKDWKSYHEQIHLIENIEINNILVYQTRVLQEVLLKKWDVVILLGHARIFSVWMAALICRLKGIPVIIWGHGLYGSEKGLKKTFLKTFISMSDKYLVYGEYAKSLMKKANIKEKNIHVVYNSVNYELTLDYRNQFISPDFYTNYFKNNNNTLIFIGRLTKTKKLNLLLKAMVELKALNNDLNLMMIGDGDEKQNLKDMAIKNHLNVHFYGSCYSEEKIAKFMTNADLCVSPGNVGLTAIHALSYGTPVCTHNDFSTQMPEFEAIRPFETGCFFDKKENNIASTILKWFNTGAERETIRQNCYRIVDAKYNPKHQLGVIKKTLNQLIKYE